MEKIFAPFSYLEFYNEANCLLDHLQKLAQWFNEVEQTDFNAFSTVRHPFETHHDTIINYFNGRNTNAATESYNAKIKKFKRPF